MKIKFNFEKGLKPQVKAFIEEELIRILPFLPKIIKEFYDLNWENYSDDPTIEEKVPQISFIIEFHVGLHIQKQDLRYAVFEFQLYTDNSKIAILYVNRCTFDGTDGTGTTVIAQSEIKFSDWIEIERKTIGYVERMNRVAQSFECRVCRTQGVYDPQKDLIVCPKCTKEEHKEAGK